MSYSKRITKYFLSIRINLLIIFLLLATPMTSLAQTPDFRSVFGSNMVLLHDKAVTISGYAKPDTELILEVDNRKYKFKSDKKGQWQTQIAPLSAGGPYEIKLQDNKGGATILRNILAGNVWLCSGQSNMAYSVAASIDQPDIYNRGHSAIRLFSVPLKGELNSQDEFIDPISWQVASDENVGNFSAVCYFFARETIDQDGIPLGLINASWGGSAIEAWISEQSLDTVPDYKRKVAQLQKYRKNQREAELDFANDWMKWWQKKLNSRECMGERYTG